MLTLAKPEIFIWTCSSANQCQQKGLWEVLLRVFTLGLSATSLQRSYMPIFLPISCDSDELLQFRSTRDLSWDKNVTCIYSLHCRPPATIYRDMIYSVVSSKRGIKVMQGLNPFTWNMFCCIKSHPNSCKKPNSFIIWLDLNLFTAPIWLHSPP